MIKRLAQRASQYYSKISIIEDSKQEIYAYGFELLISTVLNLAGVFFISCLFGKIFEAFLFLLAFIPMRLAAGGYHAKHHWSCILGFNLIFLSFIIFLQWLDPVFFLFYSIIVAIASSILVWYFAPVEAINKPLSNDQRQRQRKHSITLSSLNLAIALVCYFIPQAPVNLLAYYFSGTVSVAVLLLAAKISIAVTKPSSK